MLAFLKDFMEKKVSVVTNDGKCYCGVLKGSDQYSNIILNDTEELIVSENSPSEIVPLGLFLIKGDNLALLGETNMSEMNLETLSGHKLKPIVH